jgi:hypothetical protein
MHKWLWAVAAAVVAGLGTLLSNGGSAVWSGLVSLGVLAAPSCSDLVTGATTAASSMCVRPTSLVVVASATVALVAFVAGLGAYRVAGR